MTATPTDKSEIEQALELVLARPPSRAGMRLAGERDLARLFDVGYKTIRASIDGLVDKGVLARRHGSGTYVRRVPKISGLESPLASRFPADVIFAEPAAGFSRRKPLKHHVRLNVCLLTGASIPSLSQTNGAIRSGIEDAIYESGHTFASHTFAGGQGVDHEEKVSEIAGQLREGKHDGYVVWRDDAQDFKRAMVGEFSPVVYLTGEGDDAFAPSIAINLTGAIIRAVSKLASFGYKKIGLVGLETGSLPAQARLAYEVAANQACQEFRSAKFCKLDQGSADKVVSELFFANPADRPDALYVADDIVLRFFVKALSEAGVVPGRDVGIITLACRCNELPPQYDFSRMEFNPYQVGRMAALSLLRSIETAGAELCSFTHEATWILGATTVPFTH